MFLWTAGILHLVDSDRKHLKYLPAGILGGKDPPAGTGFGAWMLFKNPALRKFGQNASTPIAEKDPLEREKLTLIKVCIVKKIYLIGIKISNLLSHQILQNSYEIKRNAIHFSFQTNHSLPSLLTRKFIVTSYNPRGFRNISVQR